MVAFIFGENKTIKTIANFVKETWHYKNAQFKTVPDFASDRFTVVHRNKAK